MMQLSEAIWPFIRELYIADPKRAGIHDWLRTSDAYICIRDAVRSGAPLVVLPSILIPDGGYDPALELTFETIDDIFQFMYMFYLGNYPDSIETMHIQKAIRTMLELLDAPEDEITERLSGLAIRA